MTKLRPEHDRIMEACCDLWGVTREEMRGGQRSAHIAIPRMVAMYLIRLRCQPITVTRIGLLFGNRDHSTVIKGIESIKATKGTEPNLGKQIAMVEAFLDAPPESSPQVRDAISGNQVVSS